MSDFELINFSLKFPNVKSFPIEKVPINPYFDGTLKWPEMKLYYFDFKNEN